MAKQQTDNTGSISAWLKIALGLVSLVSTIFICGMAYSYHNSRITTTEVAVISLAEADSAIKEDIKLHKEANLETEKAMVRKHEAMLERQHQNELMVQRQLTVSETLATGQSEAKQERKEDRVDQRKYQDETGKALIRLMESQIKLESKLNEWEPDDGG